MAVQLFTFAEYNSIQIVGAQTYAASVAGQQPDFSEGSVDLALVEGASSSLLFLQAAVVQVLLLTRAATSNGTDLDSFFADFGFNREQSTASTGVGQIARSNNTTVLTIPADGTATVLNNDGTQTYTVTPNTTLTYYDIASNTYIIPIGTSTASIGLTAVTAGSIANQAVGAVLLTGANMGGVDTITVLSGLNNGEDTELDAAYRARFITYLAGLARGTLPAIESAIEDTQQGIQYTIANNQDTVGNFEPGNFVVTIDDGSGAPPDSLIAAVDASVQNYAPNTVSFSVRGPTVLPLTISYVATLAPPTGTSVATIDAQLRASTLAYVNSQALGKTPFSVALLTSEIVNSSPYVTNVTQLTVNGGTSDIALLENQVVKLTSNNLTINN